MNSLSNCQIFYQRFNQQFYRQTFSKTVSYYTGPVDTTISSNLIDVENSESYHASQHSLQQKIHLDNLSADLNTSSHQINSYSDHLQFMSKAEMLSDPLCCDLMTMSDQEFMSFISFYSTSVQQMSSNSGPSGI